MKIEFEVEGCSASFFADQFTVSQYKLPPRNAFYVSDGNLYKFEKMCLLVVDSEPLKAVVSCKRPPLLLLFSALLEADGKDRARHYGRICHILSKNHENSSSIHRIDFSLCHL